MKTIYVKECRESDKEGETGRCPFNYDDFACSITGEALHEMGFGKRSDGSFPEFPDKCPLRADGPIVVKVEPGEMEAFPADQCPTCGDRR